MSHPPHCVLFGNPNNILRVDLGGLVVSVLATGPKVRGFDPDRWIFKGDKNSEHHFLRSRRSHVVDLRHVKEPYGMNRTSSACKRNSRAISHPSLLTDCQIALAVTSGLSWTARPVGWSPNCHKCADHVTSERGGPGPYRAVEPWLLLLLLLYNNTSYSSNHDSPHYTICSSTFSP
jgi:hypothetical protein